MQTRPDLLLPPPDAIARPRRGRHSLDVFAPIFVSVDAGERSFIVFGDEERRVAECDGQCQFWALPGTYRVRLVKDAHEEETSVSMHLRNPGSYHLKVGDAGTRNAGLALGITGSSVFVVGALVAFVGVLELGCTYDDATGVSSGSCSTPSSVYYGLAAMGVGAGVASLGFVLFGTNHTGFHYTPAPVPTPFSARLGPVPLAHGGVGLGLTGSF
jgi:hypothetical protein